MRREGNWEYLAKNERDVVLVNGVTLIDGLPGARARLGWCRTGADSSRPSRQDHRRQDGSPGLRAHSGQGPPGTREFGNDGFGPS